MEKIEQLQKIVSQVRRDIVRMVHSNNSGHPGGSLGCTEFLVALYFHSMNLYNLEIMHITNYVEIT